MSHYIEVTLTESELRRAAAIGCERQIKSLVKLLKDAHLKAGQVLSDPWDKHINGACGEGCFAKHTDRYWDGSVDTFKRGGDVGAIQVRTRSKHEYELIVRANDRDEDIFVCVTGTGPWALRGWLYGRDAKRDEWKQFYGNRPPAYFVPHEFLNPMGALDDAIQKQSPAPVSLRRAS